MSDPAPQVPAPERPIGAASPEQPDGQGPSSSRRRRGSRGGRGRRAAPERALAGDENPELPERIRENAPSPEAAEKALVRRSDGGGRKPKIGDRLPAPPAAGGGAPAAEMEVEVERPRRRRGGRGRSRSGGGDAVTALDAGDEALVERPRGRERKGRPVGRYLMAVH